MKPTRSSSRRNAFVLGIIFFSVVVTILVTNRHVYESSRFSSHTIGLNVPHISHHQEDDDDQKHHHDDAIEKKKSSSSDADPLIQDATASSFSNDIADKCARKLASFRKQQQQSSTPLDNATIQRRRDAVRKRWERGPLSDTLVDQLMVYKFRVARKLQLGANAALWKKTIAEARRFMTAGGAREVDNGITDNLDAEVGDFAQVRKSAEFSHGFFGRCFSELPECAAWSRSHVMLVKRAGHKAHQTKRKKSDDDDEDALKLSPKAREVADRMHLLDGAAVAAGNGDGGQAAYELMRPQHLNFVDVFMGVKCCREHARMKAALQFSYQLLASSHEVSDDEQHDVHDRPADMSLTAGSLLAAVREDGFFIPWDTDVDLLVQQRDVQRTMQLMRFFSLEEQRSRSSLGNERGNLVDSHQERNELVRMARQRRVGIGAANPALDKLDGELRLEKQQRKRHALLDIKFFGKFFTTLLDPPKVMSHGTLLGYVYGTPEFEHAEASRVEIWAAMESKKMQKKAAVMPLQRCRLQDVEGVRCPAKVADVLFAGYGERWCEAAKCKSSNCKT